MTLKTFKTAAAVAALAISGSALADRSGHETVDQCLDGGMTASCVEQLENLVEAPTSQLSGAAADAHAEIVDQAQVILSTEAEYTEQLLDVGYATDQNSFRKLKQASAELAAQRAENPGKGQHPTAEVH